MLERYTDLPIFYCLSTNFLCLVDLCLSLIMVFFFSLHQVVSWCLRLLEQLILRKFKLLCKCFFSFVKKKALWLFSCLEQIFFWNKSCPQFGQLLWFLFQTHKEHCENFAASTLVPNPNEHAWKAVILFSTITFVWSKHHVLSWYFYLRRMFRSGASLYYKTTLLTLQMFLVLSVNEQHKV